MKNTHISKGTYNFCTPPSIYTQVRTIALHVAVAVAGGVCSDRVTLQPITCFIIGPSNEIWSGLPRRHMGSRWVDANFIGLFSHSHSHAMPRRQSGGCLSACQVGIKCHKVTRRVASTRKLCNILLNVSISVSDLAQTVAVSAKFRGNLACSADSTGTEQDSTVIATATGSKSNSNNNIVKNQQSDNNDRRRWQVAALTASF